jgi:hypothetical protein
MPNNMRPVQKKVFDNAFDFERYSEKFFAPNRISEDRNELCTAR